MRLHAWSLLDDCEAALELLELEDDPQTFRILWAAAVALLRAAGHVLHKVDAKQNTALKDIVNRHFARWKLGKAQDAVFTGFIDKERNNILKQYRFGFEMGPIDVVVVGEDGTGVLASDLGSDNLFKPLGQGLGNGEDARDVLHDALVWMKTQLSSIEEEWRHPL